MRKIDKLTRNAFIFKKPFKQGNTEVKIINEKPHLYLHGNLIAKITNDGELVINHCGWETITTKSRLNALPSVNIRINKGNFILNEQGYMSEGWKIINEYKKWKTE